MIMPRLLALAERAWASDPEWATESTPTKAAAMHRLAWSGFVNQLGKRVLPRLDAEQDAVQYRIAPPGLKRIDKQIHVNYQLPGFTLRYTTDGSEPDTHSAIVLGPIATKGLILVAAFDRNGRKGNSSRIKNK
jgi:hexosaminidase